MSINMHEPKSVKVNRGKEKYGSKNNAPDIDYGGMSEAEAIKLLIEKYGYSEQEAEQVIKTKKAEGKENAMKKCQGCGTLVDEADLKFIKGEYLCKDCYTY
jgi:formylmethanofuran dehydrogenase subunit E